jgi:hypothetical protein
MTPLINPRRCHWARIHWPFRLKKYRQYVIQLPESAGFSETKLTPVLLKRAPIKTIAINEQDEEAVLRKS